MKGCLYLKNIDDSVNMRHEAHNDDKNEVKQNLTLYESMFAVMNQ